MNALFSIQFWLGLSWPIFFLLGSFALFTLWYDETHNKKLLKHPKQSIDIYIFIKRNRCRNAYIFALLILLLFLILQLHTECPAYKQEGNINISSAETKRLSSVKPEKNILIPYHNEQVPFSNITEFNEANSKEQVYIDWLKERYESWLITYFYLKKCMKSSPQDLELIIKSLETELQSVHADMRVKDNILTAATGSYNEMYSNIACDDAHINGILPNYRSNILKLNNITESHPENGVIPASMEKKAQIPQ